MKKQKKKASQARRVKASKRRPALTLNPAEYGLTVAEFRVYEIVAFRQEQKRTTTSGDVARGWGGKNRSYTYRVLKSLIDKGLVEQYSQRYYRLALRKEGSECRN